MNVGSRVLSDQASWALIVGFLSPLVIQVLTARVASRQAQAVIAFVAFTVLGAGTAYFAGDLTGKTLVSSVLVVLVTGLTSYESMWKPLGVTPTTTAPQPPQGV